MNFASSKKIIEENDLVILYISFKQLQPLLVTRTIKNKKNEEVSHVIQTNYGALIVSDLIGTYFGAKFTISKGYLFVLSPTPHLWTKVLPHRTQILYSTDISMILLELEVKPGSIVIESGTGSGSLSHSFLHCIRGGKGHLYTFDFHKERVRKAQSEFNSHGFCDDVTVVHRDVCSSGFDLENVADAVFLDLPHPWSVIPFAKKAFNPHSGGRLCSFSPCIEQVQKTVEVLRAEKFSEIRTLEVLLREFQVKKISMSVYDPNFSSESSDDSLNSKKRKLSEYDNKCETSFVTGLPLTTMAGHTGYLTFATLEPPLQ